NAHLKEDGGVYLFFLRLNPVFPFFLINSLMGLTPMSVWQYFWISQLGTLPGTLLYVNAGTQIARIQSVSDVVSPGVLFAFFLLGIFPMLIKKSMRLWRLSRFRRNRQEKTDAPAPN